MIIIIIIFYPLLLIQFRVKGSLSQLLPGEPRYNTVKSPVYHRANTQAFALAFTPIGNLLGCGRKPEFPKTREKRAHST